MMTKAIIFDMDGLLADTEMIGYKVISDIVSEYDKKISIEEYVTNFCGKPNKDSTQHLIDMFELPMDQEEVIRNLTDRDFELIKDGVDMKYGAEEIVKYFKDKGYKLAEMKCRMIEDEKTNIFNADVKTREILGLESKMDLRI